jgi:3-hydroxybutyryl-CoA dehydrogenase/5-formyl-3-hydroxy-2-methylpyridine 4-carboxylate dehydrogenase
MKGTLIGVGTMGPGIAATLARGGLEVTCYDVSAEQLRKAEGEMRALQVKVAFQGDLARAVAGADLVVEAVPEQLELKKQLFAQLEKHVSPKTILASNTSGIPITRLQQAVEHKGRVVGMHWSNPPHIIPVVEVIAGAHTDSSVIQTARKLLSDCGLIPVVVEKDVPGFVHNRLLYAILREAISLVEKGVVSPEELDKCFKWGLGLKLAVIGPMELLDVAGLDIYEAVAGYLNADLENRTSVAPYVTKLTREKNLGMKTGKGIFDYTPEKTQQLRAARGAKLLAVRKAMQS